MILFCLFQAAVGLELWSMTPDILFDNFIITSDKYVADKWASDRYSLELLPRNPLNRPGVIKIYFFTDALQACK